MPTPPVTPRRLAAGWSLERTLPLWISALLACVLGGFCAAAYREVRRAAVERAGDRLAGIAQQLAQVSATSSAPRTAALRALAADGAVGRAVRPGDVQAGDVAAAAARLAAARQPGDSTLEGWELWTAAGERRLRRGLAAGAPDSAALAAARAEAARTDSVRRSAIYRAGGRMHVWTVVPVVSAAGGGRAAGFLAERRRLGVSPRGEQVIRQLTGEEIAVLLTSRGAADWATLGGAPAEPPYVPAADGAAPNAPPPNAAGGLLGAVGRGPGGPPVATDARGVRRYVAQAAVPQTPWVMVVTQAEDAVLRRPREFLRVMLSVGAALLAGGAVGAWLLGRHVTGPLRAVTGAAEALAVGEYERRVAVAGGGELARLATTFNTMAAGIGQAHAELAERNDALRRANAAKSQFLAMMSHELRTPLNAIGGYTELMELGLRGPVTAAQVDDLVRIRRNKDHLLSIISDILGFARADAGHLTLDLATVPVADVFADAEAVLKAQFAAKGVRLAAEPPPAGAAAHADREKLQQVVLNLLSNALRFTDAGGEVVLSCEAADVVRLRVRDTGIGIPADKLDAVFEPFVQVDATLTRRVGGAGLGLAIVRTLVGAMGGTVDVESAVGRGSTFTVTVPRADAGAPAGPGPSTYVASGAPNATSV